jgi:AcrR family transcriptional regulator
MANGTKDRILTVSAGLFQRQGLAGTGIKQILAEADAPFSSLYHHFPGGKEELAAQTVRESGARYERLVSVVWDSAPDVVTGVRAVFDGAAETLEATGFADACPIATVALEVASTNERLRLATADVFAAWIDGASDRLRSAGMGEDSSRRIALAVIALLEGAFILCRAARQTEPMVAARDAASAVVESALGAPGTGVGGRGLTA